MGSSQWVTQSVLFFTATPVRVIFLSYTIVTCQSLKSIYSKGNIADLLGWTVSQTHFSHVLPVNHYESIESQQIRFWCQDENTVQDYPHQKWLYATRSTTESVGNKNKPPKNKLFNIETMTLLISVRLCVNRYCRTESSLLSGHGFWQRVL